MKKIIDSIKSMPKGVKASIAFFLASFITKGIAYITTPIYTRLLSPDEFGQVSVFLTWLQVFGIIAMFCLQAGVFNNGMVDYPDNRNEYSFSMLILSNIITIMFLCMILIMYPVIGDMIDIDISLIILMFVVFLFQPAYNFWTSRQRYELKYKTTVFWTVFSAIISPVVAVLAILFNSKYKLYARIFGAEIPLIIIYICFYIYIAYKSKFRLNKSYWKTAILFNLPLIPHYLSSYLLGSSDKVMISKLVSDDATAFYSVAYSVASVVTIIWSSANATLIPFTYENCKKKNYKKISDVTIPILIIFAVACVFLILLAPELVLLMAPKEYYNAIYVIPPIVGGVFFQVHYYIYANILYYYKKPKYVMIGSVLSTLINIFLNYVFISKYGYVAAGYTTLVSYIIQAIIDYIAMKRTVGSNVYDMKKIGILSGIVILIALFSNLIYNKLMIRYLIILLIFIMTFTFRKKIISIFVSIKRG